MTGCNPLETLSFLERWLPDLDPNQENAVLICKTIYPVITTVYRQAFMFR